MQVITVCMCNVDTKGGKDETDNGQHMDSIDLSKYMFNFLYYIHFNLKLCVLLVCSSLKYYLQFLFFVF